jgi:hypothetical protein
MNPTFVYQLYKELQDDNLSFIYKGQVSDDITQRMVDLSEFNIHNNKQALKKLKKKVPIVMVECFQNIIRHRKSLDNKATHPIEDFTATRNIGKNYYITSANVVQRSKIEYLTSQLKKINRLSEEELKELYLEVLAHGEMSEEGGAGLGLIEIAKKSGNELTFDFNEINEKQSLFFLCVKMEITPPSSEISALQFSKDLYQKMSDQHLQLIFKGDFSRNSIMPILKIIEKQLEQASDESASPKKTILVLIELLQNISKHGLKVNGSREGILLLGKANGHYLISAGNLVKKSNSKTLIQQIQEINQLNKEGVNQAYKEQLVEGERSKKGGAGLGIIEMMRNSVEQKLHYTTNTINDNTDFIGLQLKV